MVVLLDPQNVCGQNLLKLVARGSTILAEMQRLSENIPKVFFENSVNSKYKNILFEFDYFKKIDACEDLIQKNPELVDLDEYFKNNYMDLLNRFYILFESIYLYHKDLKGFIQQVQEAVYIQYTFDNLLQDQEGRKIVPEAFYLFGCMLLLMERLIPGPVREKIMVAFFRYSGGQCEHENMDNVIRLTSSTQFLPAEYNGGIEKRPEDYPDFLFDRFNFEAELIDKMVIALKEGDIYKHKAAYPDNEHRSFAFAAQANMIFVLLYFVSDTLKSQKGKMRQVVDKHFYDNWVIPFYLGYTVDLTSEWAPYMAAREALANTLDLDYIAQLAKYFEDQLKKSYNKCKDYLNDGVLNEEYVLDKISSLLSCLRESNTTLRWLMLHRNTIHKKARALCSTVSQKDILQLLLLSSKFEEKLKTSLKNLIDTKAPRWEEDKKKCAKRMEELSNYFGGGYSLGDIQTDEGYKVWFAEMKSQIELLSFEDFTYAGRKIKQLSEALEDIEQYDIMSKNLQIRQYLIDTRKDLKHMVRIVHVKEEYLTHIDLIADISYSWQSLQGVYVQIMQDKIKKNPQLSLLLKTTFMKLSSILNTPMVRIVQAESNDCVSVSKFYSGMLLKFVNKVLQIIPISVFDILQEIITLLTQSMKKLPPKLKKEDLKEYAQPEDRCKMADLTYKISLFTESILSMEKYLIGVIEVNPKSTLDDGIRKELIKCIARLLETRLIFPNGGDLNSFYTTLSGLAEHLSGFKRALEYIQDFIGNFGLKLFHEEFDRLILTYIDMEQIAFVTNKLDYEELLYDEDIPMPDRSLMEKYESVNFMGRLLKELMRQTDSKQCIFIEKNLGFYEITKGTEIITMKTMDLLYKCVGISGLNGLDQLFSFMIASQMKTISKLIRKELTNKETKTAMTEMINGLRDFTLLSDGYDKQFALLKKTIRPLSVGISERLQKVGQMILLRRMICLQLQVRSKVGSNRLFLSLETLNDSVLNDYTNRQPNEALDTVEAIDKTTKLFNFVGLSDPTNKVYLTIEPIEGLSLVMVGIILNLIPNMDYSNKLGCLTRKTDKSDKQPLDPTYLLNGLTVFLNQFNSSQHEMFAGLLGYYVKSNLNYMQTQRDNQKSSEFVADLLIIFKVYEQYVSIRNIQETQQDPIIPIELLSDFKDPLKK